MLILEKADARGGMPLGPHCRIYPGWASGNALAVIISGPNSDVLNDTRIAKAYDDSAAAAPVLVVTYE